MISAKMYDTAIIGGGLAGLTLAISLAKQGFAVILFEKETYPFHKVCGEYISLESWAFLENEIGVPLSEMNLPIIKKLQITAPNGNTINKKLDLGGFGISRYTLDNTLKNIAEKCGVAILQNCKVSNVESKNNIYYVQTTLGNFNSKLCAGAWGKRSNIDIKWKRNFTTNASERLSNYVGVKYHVNINAVPDEIALHNFKDGYCGISKIEDNKYCVCYLTKASNIKETGSIKNAELLILAENPQLKIIFEQMQILYVEPLTISQISFSKKKLVENKVFMLGDAAGMIPPLCGNGMSMAMHSSKILSTHMAKFLLNQITFNQLVIEYNKHWNSNFATRLAVGKIVQYFFGKKISTNIFIAIMKRFKFIAKYLVTLSHGKTY